MPDLDQPLTLGQVQALVLPELQSLMLTRMADLERETSDRVTAALSSFQIAVAQLVDAKIGQLQRRIDILERLANERYDTLSDLSRERDASAHKLIAALRDDLNTLRLETPRQIEAALREVTRKQVAALMRKAEMSGDGDQASG